MNFRTEPPTAPLPPIVKQMAVSHVQHVRDCECCGQGHLTNACMSCGRIWPCDVSLLLTTLWGAQKIRTLWDSAMLPDEYRRWVALDAHRSFCRDEKGECPECLDDPKRQP